LIDLYRSCFSRVDTKYFGAISYLAGALVWFFGDTRAKQVSDWVDSAIGVKRSAFKFVLIARKADDGSGK
jgi:hypothetical protein